MVTILTSIFFTLLTHGSANPDIDIKKPGQANQSSVIIQYGRVTYLPGKVLKTSPGIFSLLNFKQIEWKQYAQERFPEGIVLPLKTKLLLFGDDPAIGKVLVADSVSYEVIGIIRDLPERSQQNFDICILSNKLELSPEALTNIKCSIIM